jgi:twitching motility protein PilT
MYGVDSTAIDPYLRVVWDRGGTDLLITAGAPPLARVDGQLGPIEGAPKLTHDDLQQIVLGMLDPEHRAELLEKRQIDFSFNWAGVARLRANAFVQRGSLALSLRVIPYEIPTFDQLGLPPVCDRLVDLPQGLVLVTGPTGAGKTTTLASMIDSINTRRSVHIITIEEPLEYVHHHKRAAVNQREVGVDCHSFAEALRASLREDPDVLLVGEMRDLETIQTAITLAETGHLVFATLHTNDAAATIDRIVDVFPAERQDQVRVQVAGSLAAVISQRLLPRIGGGRVAAFEVLIATYAVRNLVRDSKSAQLRNAIATGGEHGMQTLEASLSDLVARGLVTYEDACRVSVVPKEIERPGVPSVSRAASGRRR